VFRLPRFLRARPGLGHARGQDEVLAEGVALETLGEEERIQAGVAFEGDAEHLVGLAFVPGGARVDLDGGREYGGVVRDGRPYEEAADRSEGDDVGRDAETGAGFVDGTQPVEVRTAESVACGLQGGEPGRRRYVDRQDLVRLLGRGVRAEEFLDGDGEPTGHRASPVADGCVDGGVDDCADGVPDGGCTRPL
jgi:hypothetical protein